MQSELELATERMRRVRDGETHDSVYYNAAGELLAYALGDKELLANAYLDQQSPVVLDWPDADGWWWMELRGSRKPCTVRLDGEWLRIGNISQHRDRCGAWREDWQPRFIRAFVPVFPAREA